MLDERTRPFSRRPGADPSVADLVGDRFGEQVVTRSVDPLLAGVYAGSAATIGLRSAAPTLAAALDRGARNLTDAVREAWQVGAAATIGVRRPRWRIHGACRRARPPGRHPMGAGDRRTGQPCAARMGAGRRRGGALVRRRDGAGRPCTAAAESDRGSGAADSGGGATHRRRVHGTGCACTARRHPAARAVRGAGGKRRTVARQGDYVVEPQMGAARQR